MPKIKYRLSLTSPEREELETIVRKGKHRSQKVLNALILLNCDERAPMPRTLKEQEIAEVLNISAMKLYRVKQRFVDEGLEIALNGHKGQRAYEKKADGEFEAHLVASAAQNHRRAMSAGRYGCWPIKWWNYNMLIACRMRRFGAC